MNKWTTSFFKKRKQNWFWALSFDKAFKSFRTFTHLVVRNTHAKKRCVISNKNLNNEFNNEWQINDKFNNSWIASC